MWTTLYCVYILALKTQTYKTILNLAAITENKYDIPNK
jgi:hypothetical protein